MNNHSQLAVENLEARLAEELEERTEFCDWISACYACCGGGSQQSCTTSPSTGSSTCTTSTSSVWK